MDKHINQILNSYHENKLSHAFLIETNNQEVCLEDLKKVLCVINCDQDYLENCNKCNLCHLISVENLPSLVIIRPDGVNVRKDQIIDLKRKFSTKPIYSKFNMYVIMNAEKLNSSSANTILKFLEEPEEGILGFFLTNNKENIIDTIKSRCQIISNFYDNVLSDSLESVLNETIDLLKEIHLSKDKSLLYNKSVVAELNKDRLQLIFQKMIDIYLYFYECKINMVSLEMYSDLSFLIKKDIKDLIKNLKLVRVLEEELNSNVNLNLLLDRLVIETR